MSETREGPAPRPADPGTMPAEFAWREGPRTEAWRELWRRLLSDVLARYERPAARDELTKPRADPK